MSHSLTPFFKLKQLRQKKLSGGLLILELKECGMRN